MDSVVSNTFLRIGAAAAIGGAMGVGGARLGTMLLDTPVYPELDGDDETDVTVVATVPAATADADSEGGSILSRIPGLGGLFGA